MTLGYCAHLTGLGSAARSGGVRGGAGVLDLRGSGNGTPAPSIGQAVAVATERLCPMCGPWLCVGGSHLAECPTCGLTAGEHAYRERILADSAAVFAQEWREFQAKRRADQEG